VVNQDAFEVQAVCRHFFSQFAALAIIDFGNVEQAAGQCFGRIVGMRRGIRTAQGDGAKMAEQALRLFDGQRNSALLSVFPGDKPGQRTRQEGEQKADGSNTPSRALVEGIHATSRAHCFNSHPDYCRQILRQPDGHPHLPRKTARLQHPVVEHDIDRRRQVHAAVGGDVNDVPAP